MQKSRIIHALQGNGHTVGYMGDGINDAVALREADVGISVDTATDIAKEALPILFYSKKFNYIRSRDFRRTYYIRKYFKIY